MLPKRKEERTSHAESDNHCYELPSLTWNSRTRSSQPSLRIIPIGSYRLSALCKGGFPGDVHTPDSTDIVILHMTIRNKPNPARVSPIVSSSDNQYSIGI